MSDTLIGTDLVINPPVQGEGVLTYVNSLTGSDIAVSSPAMGRGSFGSLYAPSFVPMPPVLGVPNFYPDSIQLFPASLSLRMLKLGKCIGTPRLTLNLSSPRQVLAPDRHVRRSGDDYAGAFSDLLPTGLAWPRSTGSVLMRMVKGLGQIWGTVDRRAADLLEQETDPRKTLELLEDWERNWGLPEECFAETFTFEDRRRQLLMKMTLLGGQSRDFFIWVASWVGNQILISEFSPFMAGYSRVGDTRDDQGDYYWQIGAPEMRFYWTIHIGNIKLTWFRASAGQAGVDPHLRIGLATDLECLLERWKPAHTSIVLDYSGLANRGPMAGTP